MKARKDEILTVVLFCGFLAVMLVCYLILPKKDFSELEKRYLEEAPEVSWENLSSGELGESIESYMADHIPGRDFFVGLNAYFDLATGRQNTKDIRLEADNRLVEAPVQWDENAVQKNMRAINAFAKTLGRDVDLLLVPSAGWAAQKQEVDYQDERIIRDIYAMAEENLKPIDLTAVFSGQEGYFYRTDHHWNSRGAYEAYSIYMQEKDRHCRSMDDFYVESVEGFYGSTYSRSALWLVPAENLELWHGSENLTVTNGEDETIHEGVFYRERLEETDKYTVNLDGNHSVVTIQNPDAEGKLLVIRDSYSNSLGTFLAESYAEVVLVDLRYYKGAISELCQEENFDDILICYSIGNFMSDANIIWLR